MAVRRLLQSKLTGGSEEEDRFLHEPSVPVEALNDEVRTLIQDLRDTMWAYPFSVGMSAPQIGSHAAVSVVNPTRENPEEDLVLINPKILSLSGKKDKKRESCMSVWGEQAEVERRYKITLEYRDLDFELKQLTATGFLSRAIQHELDHLQGILYTEKVCEGSGLQHANFFDGYHILEG